MATTTLTDRLLRTTKPGPGRTELWNNIVPGFGVRISARPTSYFFSFRSPTARTAEGQPVRRRVGLGDHPLKSLTSARAEAVAIREQLDLGTDPFYVDAVEPEPLATFEVVALDYLERYARRRKVSWTVDRATVHRILIPAWGKREIQSLTARDVRRLLEDLSERGPILANRTHTIIRSVFKWAIRQNHMEVNPARLVERLNPETPRDRVLNPNELRRLWAVCGHGYHPVVLLLRLRLLTAQRGQQLLQFRHEQIETQGEDWWWNVPSALTKTRRPYRIYLGPWTRELLQSTSLLRGGAAFEARELSTIKQDLSRYVRTSTARIGLPYWQPRDLRRTAATMMARGGVSRFIIKRVLGHADREITAVYDLYSYDREVKQAVLTLENAVQATVSGSGEI